MDRWDNTPVMSLLMVYLCLLYIRSLHSQDVTSTCDPTQVRSCCLNNKTCLIRESNDTWYGFCVEPCSRAKCTFTCGDGYCITSCKNGFWGGRCIQKCPDDCISCNQRYKVVKECFKCVVGKYGKNCGQTCPGNCSNTRCEKSSGSCLECNPGYYSDNCSKECPGNCRTCHKLYGSCESCKEGYYGQMCDKECPSNCATGFCSKNSGYCNDGCKQNFDGALCDDCKEGTYGYRCLKTCSQGCKNDVCNREQGYCTLGCKDSFSDSTFCCVASTYCEQCESPFTCTTCMNKTYGSQCESNCSVKCNGTCDPLTGKCRSCLDGFYGHECAIRCNEFCRHDVCDMMDGQCPYGCINNSTQKDCKYDLTLVNPETERYVITAVVIGVVVGVSIVGTAASVTFIRKRICKGKSKKIVSPTYDSLQGNLTNMHSTYTDLAVSGSVDDTSDHVYINTANQEAQSQT